jgi:hypothetical protein
MNRFQLEVAEMDRRHHRSVRVLSFAGAAGLVALALWSAGLPPVEWWSVVHRWWTEKEPIEQVAASARVVASPQTTLPATTQPNSSQSEGTASSVSSRPQPLYLIATTPGRNKNEGTARIGTSRDHPQTYVAGALLVNGARIAEIHSDHVVLERGKERASLFLVSAPESQARHLNALATVPPMESEPTPTEVLGVDSLGEVMRSMAYYENDLLQGLQVFPGRQSVTFAQLGLKSADVIVSIDSVAVTDAQIALEYLQTLTQGAAVSVSVRRDGAIHTLSLDGTLISAAVARTSTLAQPAPPDLARTF